jgi:hypothetical protein
MATIGREGCTGLQAVFGAKESSVRFLVQIPGSATKIPLAAFMRAKKVMPDFRDLMQGLYSGFSRAGACVRNLQRGSQPRALAAHDARSER